MSAGSEKLPALTHTAHADCREKNAVGERSGVRRRKEGEKGGGERKRKEEVEEGDCTKYARLRLRREKLPY